MYQAMKEQPGHPRHRLLVSLAVVGLVTGASKGDSLTAELVKTTYYLYEPIVVRVTLTLDQPFRVVREDPIEAIKQKRQLRRHLIAELRRGHETLCEMMLGQEFHTNEDVATDLHATTVGVLGTMIPERDESVFRFWETPGDYMLVIVDRDHGLESNEAPITIVAPAGNAATASELFQSGGLGTWLAFYGGEYSERVQPLFQRLAKEFPNTVYGEYAKMALVLDRAETVRTRSVKSKPGMYGALVSDLRATINLFDAGHPLRSRALLHLARVQQAPDVTGDPKATITQLLNETNDGSVIGQAKEFLARLDRH